jgi:predicted HTH domain antitoxin
MSENINHRGSAIGKIEKTEKTLKELVEKYSEGKVTVLKTSTLLKILHEEIMSRMEFAEHALNSWYRDGIEKDWDAETISEGKAACIGNIDSLELLVQDIKDRLNKKGTVV